MQKGCEGFWGKKKQLNFKFNVKARNFKACMDMKFCQCNQ